MPDGTPIVLAAAGLLRPGRDADVEQQAELLAEHLERAGPARFVRRQADGRGSRRRPARRTGRQVAVASYLLAPGHFQDQLPAAAPTGSPSRSAATLRWPASSSSDTGRRSN